MTADREGPKQVHEVSAAARKRWNAEAAGLPEGLYRPKTLAALSRDLDRPAAESQTQFEFKGYLAEHTVTRGETLRKLAKRYYGNAGLSSVIAEANRDQINDEDEIFVDMVLKVPILGSTASATAAGGKTDLF